MPIQEQDQAATSSTSTEKETDMTRFRQTLTGAAVATALLASLSLPSFAQTTPPPSSLLQPKRPSRTSTSVVTSAATAWSI
jgi:hypothetical protein